MKSTILDTDVIVVKVGSSTLVEEHEGQTRLNQESFQRIGSQLTDLIEKGYSVVTVTSGAIAAGRIETDITKEFNKEDTDGMAELQRLAGTGWRSLLNGWHDATRGTTNASMLLTDDGLAEGKSTLDEAIRTMGKHFEYRDLLFVNENDAITHEEISFGDNDMLSATIATRIKKLLNLRVKLILLTDADGVYEDKNDSSTLIRSINDIGAWEHVAGGSGSQYGTGGMATKFAAAKLATSCGIDTYIANGRTDNAIEQTISGKLGTEFLMTDAQKV